jgi:hypothetical protein
LTTSLLAACGDPSSSPPGGTPDGAVSDASSGCSGTLAAQGEVARVRSGLPDASGEIFTPAVAANAQGAGVVAWAEQVGGADRVLATRFEDGCWEAPVVLAPDQGVGADAVIDEDGRATVVWTRREVDGSQGIAATTVWAARYEDGAWQAPRRISAEPALNFTSYALEPQMTQGDAGGVVVVWVQRENKGDSVAWNRFDPDAGPMNGWSTPATIAGGVILGAEVQVASAGPGQLVAIWRERAEPPPFEAVTNVFASRWTGTAWSAAEPIGDPSLAGSDQVEALHLVSRGSHGVSALWLQQQGSARSYRQNDFDAASQTWAGAVPVTPLDSVAMADGMVSSIDVAGSDTGAMTLVFLAAAASQASVDLWAARFESGAGWGEQSVQVRNSANNPRRPVVGMDERGEVASVWTESDDASTLVLGRGGTNGALDVLAEIEISIDTEPSLAVSRAGHALVALVSRAMVDGIPHGFVHAIQHAPAQ